VAKVKVVNNNLDQNLNGNNFNNTASETIFSFGSFAVTSNFDGRKYIDYSNTLSSFVRAVTLDTLGVTNAQSEIIHSYTTNAVLNLDKSDLNTFIRFGSAYEYLRVSIQNIITGYTGSLFMNSQLSRSGATTYFDYTYDLISDTSSFKIPIGIVINTFGLVYNYGNSSVPDGEVLKNINQSYDKYVIWTAQNASNNASNVIGYTGNTSGRPYLMIKANGNPLGIVSATTASIDFHIKPNAHVFEEFRSSLSEYEKYIISNRVNSDSFQFTLKDPTLLDDGTIVYSDTTLSWSTSDKYNIDFNTPNYEKFLQILLTIGAKYDKIKTDLIARFLTPSSIKAYDFTEQGKMTKLLRIYGREFDQLREFIDSLTYINKVTYDKINNVPDQLIQNMSRTFGWDYFSLLNEDELVNSFLTVDSNERNLNNDLMPAEIDIELWRRILMNTNYYWKSKGTRESIKSIFLLIGIPEPFINITEYVYTVDGKINPNNVQLSLSDFPSSSLPYDTQGYPIAPIETSDFYFQVSGDTDSGQAYMNAFRLAGFDLNRTVDNKKSWSQSGATTRIHSSTPQYYQEDSRLVINTKEVDVALDTSRGIEHDVYDYIQKDFAANSSGYTLPYSYVNISLGVGASQNTFTLPTTANKLMGDFEVRFNGILLNAPKTGTTTGITAQADYVINGNSFTLANAVYAKNNSSGRDVIQVTYIYSGNTRSVSGITVDYIVTRIKANTSGTAIPLPTYPRGDVQLTVNGIALTKGTPQFVADYIVDPNNTTGSSQIIIQNQEVISYLKINPDIQVAYVEVAGSDDISARSEVIRVDSFNSSKIYFNNFANKYVYKLNYKANAASDVKVLIDGIALEPNLDYSINVQNPYEIFLPSGIRYGTVITVYYLIAHSSFFQPIINDVFGVGDISQLSFLEFVELVQKRMVNVKNRKTISDFKGGWYPALLKIYVEYLKRSTLPNDDPLKSNGYTFANLYSFLSKYNAFFQRFVDQLLPATIILRKSGLLIENSFFTKQKFMYRRGVNVYSGNSTTIDMRGNPMLKYLGDDGAVFKINQDTVKPSPPIPPTLFVETISGITGSIITGGKNIQGNTLLTEYGIEYSKLYNGVWGAWKRVNKLGALSVDNYVTTITGVTDFTLYNYRAYIRSGKYGYTGNTLQILTPVSAATTHIETKIGTAGVNNINTGGINIIINGNIDYYGMQYKKPSDSTWATTVLLSTVITGNSYNYNIISLSANTTYQYRAYISISGISYTGNILQTTTQSVPTFIPTVITGQVYAITPTQISTSGNTITNKGNLIIMEYGVLYSQNPSVSLIVENYPTLISKQFISGDTSIPYSDVLSGLAPNTETFYRAFAKNSVGIGYGSVKSAITTPLTSITPTPTLFLWMGTVSSYTTSTLACLNKTFGRSYYMLEPEFGPPMVGRVLRDSMGNPDLSVTPNNWIAITIGTGIDSGVNWFAVQVDNTGTIIQSVSC